MEQELLKTGEVLKKLKIARATLVRWRHKLGFPEPIHFGGHTRTPAYYVKADVLAWIGAHMPPKKTQPPEPSAGPEPA